MVGRDAQPALALVIALAVALRLLPAIGLSLGVDEGVSWWFSRLPLDRLPDMLRASGEPHPPLYYLTLQLLQPISEWVLRFPSVVCGTLLVLAVWDLARRLYSMRVAHTAAFAAAISAFLITVSAEARMYSMASLFLVLAAIGLVSNRPGVYLMAAVLALYTHYLTALGLLCLQPLNSWTRKRNLLLHAIMATLLAPWLWYAFGGGISHPFAVRPAPPPGAWAEMLFDMAYGMTLPIPLAGWHEAGYLHPMKWLGLVPLAFVLAVAHPIRWMLLAAFGPAVLLLLLLHLFEYKYMTLFQPFYLIALAYAAHHPWEHRARAALVGAISIFCGLNLLAWALFTTEPDFGPQDWRSAAAFIRSRWSEHDVIVVHPNMMSPALSFYLRRSTPPEGVRLRAVDGPAEALDVVSASPGTRIWYCFTPHHPFVASVRLDRFLLDHGYVPVPEDSTSFPSFFPANIITIQRLDRR